MLAGGALLVAGSLALPQRAYAYDDAETVVNTPSGPMGPADRDFLNRVHWASLWEIPAGHMAQDQAGAARVKEVGAQLEADHIALDTQVRAVAAGLGFALIDEPLPEQQDWLTELSNKTGEEFDQAFAQLLRFAHGKVFAAVAGIRAGTQNNIIRALAETAVNVVMKHMSLLESIGNVNYQSLPPPNQPPLHRITFANRTGMDPLFVWMVLAVGIVAGGFAVIRAVRPR